MQMSVTVHRIDNNGRVYRKEALKLLEVQPTATNPKEAGLVVLQDDIRRKIYFDAGNGEPITPGFAMMIPPSSLRRLRLAFAGNDGQPSLPGIEPAFLAPGKRPKARGRR